MLGRTWGTDLKFGSETAIFLATLRAAHERFLPELMSMP
jgi:hypothetical protein